MMRTIKISLLIIASTLVFGCSENDNSNSKPKPASPNVENKKALMGQDRGGGSGTAAEFMEVASALAEKFSDRFYNSSFLNVTPTLLEDVIKSLNLVPVNTELAIDGKSVDAINYPGIGKIELNRDRWKTLPDYLRKKLVLHELLGLLRVPDQDFLTSQSIMYELSKGGSKVVLQQTEITGALAKIFIETYRWDPLEIRENDGFPTRTSYTSRIDYDGSTYDPAASFKCYQWPGYLNRKEYKCEISIDPGNGTGRRAGGSIDLDLDEKVFTIYIANSNLRKWRDKLVPITMINESRTEIHQNAIFTREGRLHIFY